MNQGQPKTDSSTPMEKPGRQQKKKLGKTIAENQQQRLPSPVPKKKRNENGRATV